MSNQLLHPSVLIYVVLEWSSPLLIKIIPVFSANLSRFSQYFCCFDWLWWILGTSNFFYFLVIIESCFPRPHLELFGIHQFFPQNFTCVLNCFYRYTCTCILGCCTCHVFGVLTCHSMILDVYRILIFASRCSSQGGPSTFCSSHSSAPYINNTVEIITVILKLKYLSLQYFES